MKSEGVKKMDTKKILESLTDCKTADCGRSKQRIIFDNHSLPTARSDRRGHVFRGDTAGFRRLISTDQQWYVEIRL